MSHDVDQMTPHFHGIHPAEVQGVPGVGAGVILPGQAVDATFAQTAQRP